MIMIQLRRGPLTRLSDGHLQRRLLRFRRLHLMRVRILRVASDRIHLGLRLVPRQSLRLNPSRLN